MSKRKGVADGLRTSRLASRITELEGMLEARPLGRSETLQATDDAARAALAKAREVVDGDLTVEKGWADCNQAYLFILQGADEVERAALAKALRWETQEKISNWRKDAVREILPESGRSPEVQELVVAQFIVDMLPDNSRLASGDFYQLDKYEVVQSRSAFCTALRNRYGRDETFKKAIDAYEGNPLCDLLGRLLCDSSSPFNRVFWMFSSIDDRCRMFDQPYFANHPDEAQNQISY